MICFLSSKLNQIRLSVYTRKQQQQRKKNKYILVLVEEYFLFIVRIYKKNVWIMRRTYKRTPYLNRHLEMYNIKMHRKSSKKGSL